MIMQKIGTICRTSAINQQKNQSITKNQLKIMFHHCKSAGYHHPAFQRGMYGSPFMRGWRRPKYNIPLNITETDTHYVVEVFATGFSKENITVNVVNDVLYVSGKKEITESPNFARQEFPIKNFERTVQLNGQIDVENITAKVENGMLIVNLPKTEAAQTKERKIDVG